MALILSLETTSPICSVALHRDSELIGYSELHLDKSHSSALMPLVNHLLEVSMVDRDELEAVAVSRGPGSYTGLRIGTSSAKGLCYALDIPLISVDTLQAMAASVIPFAPEGALLVPVLDARRMEVYAEILDCSLKGID